MIKGILRYQYNCAFFKQTTDLLDEGNKELDKGEIRYETNVSFK